MPDAGSIPDAAVPPPDCDPMTTPPLPARALRISDVTVNQGVSVPLVENSTPDTPLPTPSRLYGMFPLADLDVSIRQAPLDFDDVIGADGQGWSNLCSECLSLRANDSAASNTYYYCAV